MVTIGLGQAQKLIVVLVLIVAVFALALGVFIGHSFDVVPIDTTPKYLQQYGWTGCGLSPGNNVLDAKQYVTSWNPAAQSEKIVAQAGVAQTGFTLATIREYRWDVFLTLDGIVWNEATGAPYTYPVMGNQITTGGCVSLPFPVYTVTGPWAGGIRLVLTVHVFDAGFLDKGFLEIAEQASTLVSGIGKINADQQVQVGNTASATVTVGYLTDLKTGQQGWTLYAFSTAQNKIVLGPLPVTQLTQTFTYTAVPADFKTDPTCGNGNRLQWTLYNLLWAQPFVFTTVIDITTFAPAFSFDGYTGIPVSNGTITLKFHATMNPTTLLPIRSIVLAYGFQNSVSTFANLSANATSQNIALGSNGNLHVEGYSIDTGCRPSPTQRQDIFVKTQGGGSGSTKPNWLAFFLILITTNVIGAVVAYVAKGPLWARVLLFVFFTVLGFLIAFVVIPNALNPATWRIASALFRG